MKKIGIITIHSDQNYGAALQAYALNQIIRDKGYQSEVLNYVKNPNHPPHYPFPVNILFWLMNLPRFLRFRKFLKNSISKKSWNSVDELMNGFDENYDILISGSDQVWNPLCGGLNDQINPCYYLAFASKDKYKKIAYASSLGAYRFNDEEKKIVIKWYNDYSYLSTREQSGKEHLESFLDKKVKVVLDPTLLLDHDKWLEVASSVNLNGKYVLVYYFDERDEVIGIARKVADKLGYKVALITNMPHHFKGVDINVRHVGPAQFLWLFENCAYVVTNSFHGTAFAVNFNKPFISVIKRNSPQRAQTFLNNVGLPERLLTDESQLAFMNEIIDWDVVNQKLEELRQDSLNYLFDSINN